MEEHIESLYMRGKTLYTYNDIVDTEDKTGQIFIGYMNDDILLVPIFRNRDNGNTAPRTIVARLNKGE